MEILIKEMWLFWLCYCNCSVVSEVMIGSETVWRLRGTWQMNLTASNVNTSAIIADWTCNCGDVRQHQGSLWALPRARLSALCQALLMRARASLQRFWRDESNTSLCGRSTCEEWQSTRAQPLSFPGHLSSLLCGINVILLTEVFSTHTW